VSGTKNAVVVADILPEATVASCVQLMLFTESMALDVVILVVGFVLASTCGMSSWFVVVISGDGAMVTTGW
jgi:hypothetical protein